jgi:hypothetical protein
LDEIDLQLITYAAARHTGADHEEEEDTIDNPDISEGELEVDLLRIRSALRAPAVTRSRTASLAHEQRERERATDPQGCADRLFEEQMADATDVTGGVAASATLGGSRSRVGPPVTQQRTPHVDALVDSGCNQHLFKDLSLFVTVDRNRVMQPFTVASDRTTTPQGYGTARFGVTDETGSLLTVTLPGCYLDETLPFNLLSVSQLLEAGALSNPDFSRRELHFLDCPDFMDADPRTGTVPMNSEGGLYSLRLTPLPRLVAQASSGGPPQPSTKLKEPMQVLAGVRGTVDWQLVRSCVRRYGALYGNALGVFDMDLFTDGLGPVLGNSQCEQY